jgi:hypothetical protein
VDLQAYTETTTLGSSERRLGKGCLALASMPVLLVRDIMLVVLHHQCPTMLVPGNMIQRPTKQRSQPLPPSTPVKVSIKIVPSFKCYDGFTLADLCIYCCYIHHHDYI